MRSGFGILAVTGALLLSSPVRAEDEKSAAPVDDKPKVAAESPSGPGTAHLMVARDPVTGELRAPTAAEREALKAIAKKALSRVGEPTLVETLPDGRVRARLGPEHARFSVVRRNPDGTLSSDCVAAGKVDAAASAAVPAASAPAVK
jgi:hypothetical protein